MSGFGGAADSVFIVGCGRSGTTLLYELLATHPAFAWPSTWTDRTLQPSLAVLNEVFRRSRRGSTSRRGIPRPSEAYRLWDASMGSHGGATGGILSPEDVTGEQISGARAMAQSHRRWSRSPVFLNKNTRNTRRIAALDAIFPDAVFVHVLRSPLDVVSSLLAVAWWPELRLWSHAGEMPGTRPPDEQARMAAELWVEETQAAVKAAAGLPGDRYIEVHYEDVLDDPRAAIAAVLARLSLDMATTTERALNRLAIRQTKGSYRTRLTAGQQNAAWEVAHSVAHDHGYASDSPNR